MKAQEIREAFLEYFERRGHKAVPSSSLLPKDDPTILFTNAGMNQFKNVFLGLEKRSYRRAASVQKCLRVSGKHNDLEQVGRTSKHHTFFEMLGNFSFGDYFKTEAITFAWELVTEVLRLDPLRLYATIYDDDEEAYRIWKDRIGIPAAKIFRFGKKDNFWAMGDTGPCGPCSELHYDIDPDLEAGDPYHLIEKGSDRFIELWNLVFMQYHQDEQGILNPLPSPSIDTGMGLERTATALQKKKSNFETDLFSPLVDRICELGRREYPSEDEGDVSVRIIADHIRAISFLIGDGIMPSNEGRGYVLRRLVRRAFRHGNLLGIEKPFLHQLVALVADVMKDAYPELLSSVAHICRVCRSEEERFSLTLSSGLRYFHQFVEEARGAGRTALTGAEVFRLYDTFGFPLDLSLELAGEQGIGVDEGGFAAELEAQRQRARLSWKGDAGQKQRKAYEEMENFAVSYEGYERDAVSEAEVLAVIKDGRCVSELKGEERGEVVLDRTPFYAEAGGQVGDSGRLAGPRGATLVENTYFPTPDIIAHRVRMISGVLKVGDKIEARVDAEKRRAIGNSHTATHLLHASLRQVLGDHVKQAGSLVSEDRLRFDFTHFSALSRFEVEKAESLVNRKIRENISVSTKTTTLEKGMKEGATAIFEEKYGESVRMVAIEGFSKELCGGVHVRSTGEIGMFKIVSESSIAAGMRRIEALTGEAALRHVQETESVLAGVLESLKASRKDLLPHVEKLMDQLGEKDREIRQLRQKLVRLDFREDEEKAREIKGVTVLARRVEGLSGEELRNLADTLKQKIGSGIVMLATASEDKVLLVVAVTKDLVFRVKAGELVREIAAVVGGGGGGRDDFAQAGGKNPALIEQAFEKGFEAIERLL